MRVGATKAYLVVKPVVSIPLVATTDVEHAVVGVIVDVVVHDLIRACWGTGRACTCDTKEVYICEDALVSFSCNELTER